MNSDRAPVSCQNPGRDPSLAPNRCPLCGAEHPCQLCASEALKSACWRANLKIPAELLARVPADLRNQSCICPACVAKFHRAQAYRKRDSQPLPADFYFENGMVVFTAEYHLRRGYCCGSRCRHCPYPVARATSNQEDRP